MKPENRLRAFALRFITERYLLDAGDAVLALAEEPDPCEWKPWQETHCESGQWFLWRDPAEHPVRLHADQVEPDDSGRIGMKHGCGLDYYPECQPVKLAQDVLAAVTEARASGARISREQRARIPGTRPEQGVAPMHELR